MNRPAIHVLYAEDNRLDADLTSAYFKEYAPDFELEIVSNGRECLDRLAQAHPDLLLLDHHLPDMEGIEILKIQLQSGMPVPVVLVTGVGNEELVVKALRLGASNYVSKSGSYLDTLPGLLRGVIEDHRRKKIQGKLSPMARKVLYVEHNAMDIELTQTHLAENAPHLVLEAVQTYGEALARLEQPHTYHLILADLRMPDLSGLEFLHEAKQRDLRLPPLIMITGKGDDATAIAALMLGAAEYIAKRDNYLAQLTHTIDHVIDYECIKQLNQKLQAELAERIKAEEILATNQSLLQGITDNSNQLIYALDLQGKFLLINRKLESLFGKSRKALIGKTRSTVLPKEVAAAHRANDLAVIRKQEPVVFEEENIEPDGKHTYLSAKFPLLNKRGKVHGVAGISTDITERKRVQEEIEASLREKETLLKEVHHRVKNNLMTIIGLIRLQESKADNGMLKPLLEELEGRIHSIAMVHEGLCKSKSLARINLHNYIETLSAHIRDQHGAERDIGIQVQAASVEVELDIAVPCGLILNELIHNAYKHAFPGDMQPHGEKKCEIHVEAAKANDAITLTVADNGVGLPAGLEWEQSRTLGLSLIRMLSKQLHGSIEWDCANGTRFQMKFKNRG